MAYYAIICNEVIIMNEEQRQREFEELERELERRFAHIDQLLAKFYKIRNARIEAQKAREANVAP